MEDYMTSIAIEGADQAAVQRPATLGCAHYWMIEPASGPCSAGTCMRCGATREFRNSTESVMWERSDDRDARLVGLGGASEREVRLSDDL